MNFKDVLISREKIEQKMNENDFDYIVLKNTPDLLQLEVENWEDEGTGILNIYFKINGKTTFMFQGKNKEVAQKYAENLLGR